MNDDKSTSDSQVDEILEGERFVDHVYKDEARKDTVGYGHLLTDDDKKNGTYKNGISKEDAKKLFRKDLKKAEDCVKKYVTVPLTQNQFDALVDFVYNAGCGALRDSTLLGLLNNGEYDKVPGELKKFNKITDKKTKKKRVSRGLINRRNREIRRWRKKGDDERKVPPIKEKSKGGDDEKGKGVPVEPKPEGKDEPKTEPPEKPTPPDGVDNSDLAARGSSDFHTKHVTLGMFCSSLSAWRWERGKVGSASRISGSRRARLWGLRAIFSTTG